MPWQEVVTVELRQQFVHDALRRVVPVTELCAAYGISRKTGYKFLARYDTPGNGRPRRSVAPSSPLARRPRSGVAPAPARGPPPPSVLGAAEAAPPGGRALAGCALARALHRRPLLPASGAGHRPPPRPPPRARRARPRAPMDAPNAVWTTDYKGQFKLGDGQYCFPLTVADGYSRMLLACQALTSTKLVEARPIFERLFREYGLPRRIRSDNGVPFATQALGRLSSLAVWWIRLGILPDLTEPGSPHQNGRHERMHLTLKRECTRPPRHNRAQQQRCFDRWRQEYNTLRPHEALDDATPASGYTPSPRPYPASSRRWSIPATTRSAG